MVNNSSSSRFQRARTLLLSYYMVLSVLPATTVATAAAAFPVTVDYHLHRTFAWRAKIASARAIRPFSRRHTRDWKKGNSERANGNSNTRSTDSQLNTVWSGKGERESENTENDN